MTNTTQINVSTQANPNKFVTVDADLADEINKYKWCLSSVGYAFRTSKKKTISLHRFILKAKKEELVDHIDGNPLNNTKANLRIATTQQNAFNMKKAKHNTSGYKGVSWHKVKKLWQACAYSNKTSQFLGFYLTKEEAGLAYNLHIQAIRGEFAKLNTIPNESEIIESVKERMELLGKGQKGQPKKFRNLNTTNKRQIYGTMAFIAHLKIN